MGSVTWSVSGSQDRSQGRSQGLRVSGSQGRSQGLRVAVRVAGTEGRFLGIRVGRSTARRFGLRMRPSYSATSYYSHCLTQLLTYRLPLRRTNFRSQSSLSVLIVLSLSRPLL